MAAPIFYTMDYCHPIRTNAVIDVVLDEGDSVAFPVTLDVMKDYLKISTTADDELIVAMITEARIWAEKRCGISIVEKEVTAIIEVMNEQELPYGPIQKDTIVVVNSEGDTVTDPVLIGLDGGYISLRGVGRFEVSYTAGMATVPQDLQGAIKAYVAFSYENRGDELDKSAQPFAVLARKKSNMYKRTIGF